MSFTAAQQELLDDFRSLEDELEKFTYLTYLGNQLGIPEDQTLLADEFLVRGCQSETWLRVSLSNDALHVESYSDTLIVRGLLYMLRTSVEGLPPAQFDRMDLEALYEESGLHPLLTASRRSGLSSILAETEKQVKSLLRGKKSQ